MKIICNDDLDEWTYQNLVAPIEINMREIDEHLSARNFCTLIAMLKLPLDADVYEKIAAQYADLDEKISDAFVYWFSQYKSEFLEQPEFYLRKEKDARFFKAMFTKVMTYAPFTVQERADWCRYLLIISLCLISLTLISQMMSCCRCLTALVMKNSRACCLRDLL